MDSRLEHYKGQVVAWLNQLIESFEESKDNLIRRIEDSPSNAIQWEAASIIEAEEKANAAEDILFITNSPEHECDILEALKIVTKNLKKDLMYQYGGNSTNPYSNANDLHSLKAKASFVNRAEGYIRAIEEVIAEEDKKKDLIESVTDTTKYVIEEQRNSLLKQYESYSNQQKSAKTKRDSIAFEVAAQAITSAISNLDKMSEELKI